MALLRIMTIDCIRLKPNNFSEISFHASVFKVEAEMVSDREIIVRLFNTDSAAYIQCGVAGKFEIGKQHIKFDIKSVTANSELLTIICHIEKKLKTGEFL
ncbi:MAG: hypothetical protein JNL74_16580 [Fibrobacteres bacterium]|nr:hypothetical protein [Fibrobacterota bacterium]